MGYIKHHTIVVTSTKDKIDLAKTKADGIFKTLVSEVIKSNINGYYSFFIAPDGSKEGWAESNTGDDNRDEFIEWVNQQAYEDGSNSISFAELYYGEDNNNSQVTRHN